MRPNKKKKYLIQRENVAKRLPINKVIRGTLLKRYLECSRPNCYCHKSIKNRHGPYYFLSIRRKNKSFHIYIPLSMQKEIKQWIQNYNLVWEGIEKITDINIQLIQSNRHKKIK